VRRTITWFGSILATSSNKWTEPAIGWLAELGGEVMDPKLMLQTAVVLLALTAAGGLLMAFMRFRGRPNPPSWIAMGHGLLAGSALTLILYPAFTVGIARTAVLGLVVLLAAAAGGLLLNLNYHVKHRELPIWLVLVHAAVAVVGFVILAIAVW
jgi:hypothetical protein